MLAKKAETRNELDARHLRGDPLCELKLLVVGRGGAGKTTLLRCLAGDPAFVNEPATHSINIRELNFQCPSGLVRARAWDFGGQEILHATHQFFLTERSLYLLVLEPRSGMAERDAEYWLRLIENLGGHSPVIVVGTKSRTHPVAIDELKLRRKFPFIVDFVRTEALSGGGIAELHAILIETIEKRMPDVWTSFPTRWFKIKDAIAGMTENFLSYRQY